MTCYSSEPAILLKKSNPGLELKGAPLSGHCQCPVRSTAGVFRTGLDSAGAVELQELQRLDGCLQRLTVGVACAGRTPFLRGLLNKISL